MLIIPKRTAVVVVDGQPHVMNLEAGPQEFPDEVADAFVNEGAADYADSDDAPAKKRGRPAKADSDDAPLE